MPGRVRLGLVGAVLAAAVLGACDAGSSDETAAAGDAEPAATDDVTTAGEPLPTPAEAQRCTQSSALAVSDANTVTFAPINGVVATTAHGEPLVIVGTVYSMDCRPLAGARLSMWQTDGNGEYGPGHGSDGLRCCYLGGSVVTDAQGRFQLITVRPGHYRGQSAPPPAHIHVEVRHPDASPLDTEIVFSDDDRLPANAQSRGLIVTTPAGGPGGWRAVAEIMLEASRAHD